MWDSVSWKDALQAGAWLIAILGGTIGGFKAIKELAASRRLREEELRWRKAGEARGLLERIQQNARIRDAYKMLEWNGLDYPVSPNLRAVINQHEVRDGLRPHNEGLGFNHKEAYVRECFDALLDEFATCEHQTRRGLIDFEDVAYPLEYYVNKMRNGPNWAALEKYIDFYHFRMSKAFILRFDARTRETEKQ